jgi:hypothetical protein
LGVLAADPTGVEPVAVPAPNAEPLNGPDEPASVAGGAATSPGDEATAAGPTGVGTGEATAAEPTGVGTDLPQWQAGRDGSGGYEQWSTLALVASIIGAVPITWAVPILSLMAVAFGLVGIRNCQLDTSWRNRWMGVLGAAIGLATLITAIVLTTLNRLQFLPFWTTN